MPRGPPVTPTKRARILAYQEEGWSQTKIASKLGLTQSSVSRHLKILHRDANFYRKTHKLGRPSVLNQHDMKFAARKFYSGAAKNSADLGRQFYPEVKPRTLRRHCQNAGLHGRRCRNVPLLTKNQIQQRALWSRSLQAWGRAEWDLVVFSDESKICLIGSDGAQYCRRRDGDALNPLFTKKSVKFGGGSIMIWGCITSKGVGRLYRIEGKMNKEYYVQILSDALLGSLRDHSLGRRSIIFQQDNDPKHTSRLAVDFLKRKHILVLPWPANSPDMNIIEHVWDYLKRKVHSRTSRPRNKDHLWEIVEEEWKAIDPAFIQRLYGSMARRVDTLWSHSGGNTKY